MEKWQVKFNRNSEKQYKKLKHNGSRPAIIDTINLLLVEMTYDGPYRNNWENFGPLKENDFHCHLKKGKPTYVACWKIIDKKKQNY